MSTSAARPSTSSSLKRRARSRVRTPSRLCASSSGSSGMTRPALTGASPSGAARSPANADLDRAGAAVVGKAHPRDVVRLRLREADRGDDRRPLAAGDEGDRAVGRGPLARQLERTHHRLGIVLELERRERARALERGERVAQHLREAGETVVVAAEHRLRHVRLAGEQSADREDEERDREPREGERRDRDPRRHAAPRRLVPGTRPSIGLTLQRGVAVALAPDGAVGTGGYPRADGDDPCASRGARRAGGGRRAGDPRGVAGHAGTAAGARPAAVATSRLADARRSGGRLRRRGDPARRVGRRRRRPFRRRGLVGRPGARACGGPPGRAGHGALPAARLDGPDHARRGRRRTGCARARRSRSRAGRQGLRGVARPAGLCHAGASRDLLRGRAGRAARALGAARRADRRHAGSARAPDRPSRPLRLVAVRD